MESKPGRLSLDATPMHDVTTQKLKGKAAIADSWEDESVSDIDAETDDLSGPQKPSIPNPPPPTPNLPTGFPTWDSGRGIQNTAYVSPDRGEEERRRPEKSTAVAGRLIAGALGVKAPKKTEEQRAYDRAVKEQEIKRKNREKAAKEKEKEEAERAKSAVWDG